MQKLDGDYKAGKEIIWPREYGFPSSRQELGNTKCWRRRDVKGSFLAMGSQFTAFSSLASLTRMLVVRDFSTSS